MRRALLHSLIVPALVAAGVSVHAAGGSEKTPTLGTMARPPVVDGAIKAGEYSLTGGQGELRLHVSRGKDILYLGASAPSHGWVGVGIILVVVLGLIVIFMRFSRR